MVDNGGSKPHILWECGGRQTPYFRQPELVMSPQNIPFPGVGRKARPRLRAPATAVIAYEGVVGESRFGEHISIDSWENLLYKLLHSDYIPVQKSSPAARVRATHGRRFV